MANRKLKPYFQSHQIRIKTSHPLKNIFEGKNQSSRVADWSNQLVETIGTTPNHPNQELKLYMCGLSIRYSSGARIIFIASAGVKMEHVVCLEFVASNNETECEALLLGINICYNSGARILSAFSDS